MRAILPDARGHRHAAPLATRAGMSSAAMTEFPEANGGRIG
jgi:hypothetical protein